MFHKALVGIDGQEGGLDAAALARQLVAPDGELVLANIGAGYPVAAKGETGAYERVLRGESRAVLEQACAQTGVRSSVSHFSTSVGRGLQELAERESADLVVVGATRRGPAARIFIGDDTRETVRAVRGAVAVAVAPARRRLARSALHTTALSRAARRRLWPASWRWRCMPS
jgi:nucleotide-binding universal stress UspA family protein